MQTIIGSLIALVIAVGVVAGVFHISAKAALIVIGAAFVLTCIMMLLINFLMESAQQGTQRAQEQARHDVLLAKYGDEQIVSKIMNREIWQGMWREQVIDALGEPVTTDNGLSRNKVLEVLKYYQDAVDQYRMRITLEDGVVTEWMQRG